jgi:hypothetical protein
MLEPASLLLPIVLKEDQGSPSVLHSQASLPIPKRDKRVEISITPDYKETSRLSQ